jgi:hypothetical protein
MKFAAATLAVLLAGAALLLESPGYSQTNTATESADPVHLSKPVSRKLPPAGAASITIGWTGSASGGRTVLPMAPRVDNTADGLPVEGATSTPSGVRTGE